MNRFIRRPPFLAAFIAVAATLGYLNSLWFGWSFWTGFAGISVAMLVVGWLATVEDSGPGGWNHLSNRKEPYL